MADLNGQEIRGYVIQELIATGGFAAVYRALQTAVGREVAIKVVLPKYANNPDFVRRFEVEAQLVARLDHLHIVPLYDYWREPNNAYLVMRWLRGGNLLRSIQRHGPWELLATARLLDQVTAALTAAHRHGVIHQDLTPANILLDEENNAYLADFGIAHDLIRNLAKIELEDQRLYGSPSYIAPERVRREPVSPQTDIYSLGIILYQILTGDLPFKAPTDTTLISKHLTEPIPPLQLHRADLPDELNSIILRAAAKDPKDRYTTALSLAGDFRRLLVDLEGGTEFPYYAEGPLAESVPVRRERTLVIDGTSTLAVNALQPANPYKGLRPFDEADAKDFFGRDRFVQRLVGRLAEDVEGSRFLAVVGPSGSGKSSVVKAGLVPALRRGPLPGSNRWFVAKMVPGDRPFQELEWALLSVAFGDTTSFFDQLREGPQGLGTVVKGILPETESQVLLVIDQFEELFTLVQDEAERTLFLQSLHAAVADPASQLRVVITLRADFYDRPLLYPGFGELVRNRTEVVLPLTPGEIQEVILSPAEQAHLVLEPDLVAEVVSDVTTQPGALPLLQYTLTELFEQRTEYVLTLLSYRSSGGVLGTLARRAEEIYTGLDPAQQAVARQLFLRLVNLGEEGEETRRRVRWAELTSIAKVDRAVMQTVLDTFGRFRLLTFDRDAATREPTVEVAHEALLRQWARLREWLAEDRESLLAQRRLALSAEEWIKSDRHNSFLTGGARLVQFEQLLSSETLSLTDHELEYLQTSIAARQRAVRWRRLAVAGLAVAALVFLVLAIFALDRQRQADKARHEALVERDRADEQSQVSRSRELAMTALTQQDQLDLSLLLGVEAFKVRDTLEARDSLLTALGSAPYLVTFLHDNTSPVRAVAFSPDGTRLASSSRDGMVVLWDAASHRSLLQFVASQGDRINALAFSPDGARLATGGDAGLIQLWDANTGSAIGSSWTGHEGAIWSLTFSPDGARLVSGGADGTIRQWDAGTGEPVGDPLTGHTDAVYSVTYRPDGTQLASGSADNTIRLWDAATGKPVGQPWEGHTNWVWSVAFSPDGNQLASGSADNTIRVWDVTTGETVLGPLAGHTDWVRSVAYSPDGSWIVSGSADATVRVWEASSGEPVLAPLSQHHDAVWGVAFSPDGHTLASGSADTRVILWDLRTPDPLWQLIGSHQEPVFGVAFSPDGRRLASAGGSLSGGGQDNAIRLWDTATDRAVGTLAGHTDTVSGIAFTPDSQTLVSASYDRTLIVWDVASDSPRFDPLTGHLQPITALAVSAQAAASGSDDGQILLWDMTVTPPTSVTLTGPAQGVTSLAFSPDGKTLVSGYMDGTLVLWDAAQQRPLQEPLQQHTDAVTSLAFSPDGTLLASGSRDKTIILWKTASWEPARLPLVAHTNWVLSVAFSPDGTLLASGSRDGSIILWDVASGRALGLPLRGHTGWVLSVACSPDGRTLASGSTDNTVARWQVNVPAWEEKACDLAHRNLDAAEQERYFGAWPYTPTCPLTP